MSFDEVIDVIGKAVDAVGVATIVIGGLWVLAVYVGRLARARASPEDYRTARQRLGRAILLGLELLVAGDIIRTVGATPTFGGVALLGLIVLIRTFLSFALEVELNGRWPWQRRADVP